MKVFIALKIIPLRNYCILKVSKTIYLNDIQYFNPERPLKNRHFQPVLISTRRLNRAGIACYDICNLHKTKAFKSCLCNVSSGKQIMDRIPSINPKRPLKIRHLQPVLISTRRLNRSCIACYDICNLHKTKAFKSYLCNVS